MKTLTLPSGRPIPVLGQGTWNMGEDPAREQAEIAAIQLGIDLGMTLIDTAEMYGEGGSESMIGKAIAGRRDEVFLVSKVYPHNANFEGAQAACERSLKRLKVEQLDLYLLHWPGCFAMDETVDAFEALKKAGKIAEYGISNFDLEGFQDAVSLAPPKAMATDQVLYNLNRRGIEFDLLPWCREQGIPLMAYSPLDSDRPAQRQMLDVPALKAIAAAHGATPAQIALAWVLHQDGVVAIPKAVKPEHVRANRAALDIKLSAQDLHALDAAFPSPRRPRTLDML